MSSARNHRKRSHRSEPAHRFCVQQMQKFAPIKGGGAPLSLFAKMGNTAWGEGRPKKSPRSSEPNRQGKGGACMFRFKKSVPVSYDRQGYIYFTSRLYEELPPRAQQVIDNLCLECGGEYYQACSSSSRRTRGPRASACSTTFPAPPWNGRCGGTTNTSRGRSDMRAASGHTRRPAFLLSEYMVTPR